MAEFVKVVIEKNRMCAAHGEYCNGCPLDWESRGSDISCPAFLEKSPEEAEEIIMKWAEKHPIMTNRKKFEEVFGFALDEKCAIPITILNWLDEEYKDGDGNG